MKHVLKSFAWGFVLLTACQVSARITSEKSVMMPLIQTNPVFSTLDIEVPVRCQTESVGGDIISSSLVLRKGDFKILMQEDKDEIPDIQVEEFSFDSIPAHQAVSALLQNTGIQVRTKDKYFTKVSGQEVSGSLESVLRSLGKAGGFLYAYDSDTQTLSLFKQAHFEIFVPKNKNVVMAVLDALRGVGITEITPDWQSYTLLVTADRGDIEKIKGVLRYFQQKNPILVMQANVFHLQPKFADITWRTVLNQMGINRVRSTDSGIVGQLITLTNVARTRLLNSMSSLYQITPLTQGTVVVPDKWKARFDIGKCVADASLKSGLSVLFTADILPKEQISTTLTLDSSAGEVSAYRSLTQLDDELVLLGLPAVLMNPSLQGDLMIVFKVRLVRFN